MPTQINSAKGKPLRFYSYSTYQAQRAYESQGELVARFTFALPEDVHIKKQSFLIMWGPSHGDVFIGKVYERRKITTFDNSFSVREVRKIKLDLGRWIGDIHSESTRGALASAQPVELPKEWSEEIRDAILAANVGELDEHYFDFDHLVGGQYSDVIPQVIDSFNVAFSIFGFDPRDIPPLREEQILDFDIDTSFPGKVFRLPDGRHYFDFQGKRLYLHKVHNTPIETCLGVDLIYNFVDERRMVFVQYKCPNDEEGKKYYKSRDRHFVDELTRMKAIPGVGSCNNFAGNRESLRLCGCPVYVKLCAREIKGKRLAPYGFYYPVCVWDCIYHVNETYITLDDQPRISNDQFLDLVRSGLLGSTSVQSDAISTHLVTEANDERLKLVFTESRQ